jgi:hypothetical protein
MPSDRLRGPKGELEGGWMWTACRSLHAPALDPAHAAY